MPQVDDQPDRPGQVRMHDVLNNQLQSLGLDATNPPNHEEWQRFLNNLSIDYLDAQLKRQDQNLQKQLDEAMLLNRVIAAVTSTSKTSAILSIVCRELATTLNLSHVTCALLNRNRNELEIVAEYLNDHHVNSVLGRTMPVLDNSVTQYLLRNHGPIISQDVRLDDRIAQARILPDIDHDTTSTVLLPLLTKGRVIGILALNHRRFHHFSKDEITLAQNVAAASSQALENAHLYEELKVKLNEQLETELILRDQNAYMGALHETALGLINRLDLQSLLEAIIKRASKLLGTRHGYIYLSDEDDQWPVLKAGLGIFRHAIDSRIVPGQGLSGQAWQTGKTIVAHQTENLSIDGKELGQIYGGVAVPLRFENKVHGLIGLVHLQPGYRFTPNQIALLERMAKLVSLAIDNAKLYAAAQQELAERKRTEGKLQQAKKMAESASRAKSTFLARMSHELRTPLTAIIGYSDILNEELTDLNEAELNEDVVRIRRSAQILLDIINDVLDLSKVESGEVTMYLKRVELGDLLTDVTSVSNSLVRKNNNRLEVDIPSDIGKITVDSTKLRQSLLNLLSNAAKFTKNGTISLKARRLGEGPAEFVEIDVMDTGIGIPSHKHERVFEPFVQADEGTNAQFGGTGLGLAISRRYCRLMGGDILLESTVGEGSVFTIRLPVDMRRATLRKNTA